MKPSWDDYFLEIASVVAKRSSCTRSKVGAVIVGSDKRIRGTGYNDSPAGFPGCEACPRAQSSVAPCSSYSDGPGRCVSLHAEMNALLYTNREDLEGATIYVTRECCPDCYKMLLGTKVSRIVWPDHEESLSSDHPGD